MTDERPVSELGEFGLIERLARLVPPTTSVVEIGDDAAVLKSRPGVYLLATVDMLVEGVHFPRAADPVALGRRALAVNLSDIAAMGGTPTFALVSLAVAPTVPQRFVEALYEGLAEEAAQYEVGIVGGNVTSTPGPVSVDVCLLGEVPEDEVVLRSGAEPGDVLVVTGVLGDASARRFLSQASGNTESTWALRIPQPRLAVGRALASHHLAHAMIDLSDGLGGDLHHVARRSGVGAVLYEDRLPLAISTESASRELGLDPRELGLYGGEDYELLAAIPPDRLAIAQETVGELSLYQVGRVLPADEGVVIQRPDGVRESLPPRGWSHF